jgi:hypothetical protein
MNYISEQKEYMVCRKMPSSIATMAHTISQTGRKSEADSFFMKQEGLPWLYIEIKRTITNHVLCVCLCGRQRGAWPRNGTGARLKCSAVRDLVSFFSDFYLWCKGNLNGIDVFFWLMCCESNQTCDAWVVKLIDLLMWWLSYYVMNTSCLWCSCHTTRESACRGSLPPAVNLYRSCVGLGWLAQETTGLD